MRFIAVAFIVLLGCTRSENPNQSQPAIPAESNIPTLTSAAPAAQVDITTEEDFEEEAERDITAANYVKELAVLEKEVP
jgi:hypothetical protein